MKNDNDTRVLAIHPTTYGFGFALLEGAGQLIDWGNWEIRKDRNAQCRARVLALINRYRPDVLVLEAAAAKGSRRCTRIRELTADLRKLAAARKVSTRSFSRQSVREVFSEFGAAFTKYEIAVAIVERFPELGQILPPPRKLWMPEDKRMGTFDAVAWGLTLFHHKDSSSETDGGRVTKNSSHDRAANATVKKDIPSGYVVVGLGKLPAAHAL